MSGFFSANVTSPFPDPNQLFDASKVALAGQTYQANQLLNQGRQLDLSNANMEQVGRAAAGLLDPAVYPDEASRAAAYPRVVGMLQSQGYALHAPAQYPGEGALKALVAQTVSVADQYKMGLITPPGLTDALTKAGAPPPGYGGVGTTATPGAAAAPGPIEQTALTSATAVRDGLIKRGMDPVSATAFAANKLHESGATLDSGPGDGGASQGNFMWNGDRNTEYQQIYGHSPQGAPLDEQLDFLMHELNGKESRARDAINAAQGVDGKAAAISKFYLRPKQELPEMQRRSATALQLQRQLASTAQPGAPGGATAPDVLMGDAARPDLAPPPPGGTVGIPGPYQASGGGIGSVLGGTARAARPVAPPIVTDQPTGGGVVAGPPGAAVVGQPTPPSAAVPGNVGAINAGIARAGGASAIAAQPEPGWGTVVGQYGPQNQLMPPPAVATAPPAATVAPAQPAAAQPGATPLPGTGVNSQQFQTALWKTQQAALLEAKFPYSPQAKAKAAELRAEAALYMQADSVITLPNGIQVKALSGQQLDAAKPAERFEEATQGGIHGQRNVATNQFIPDTARRISAQPNGDVINDQGQVIYHVDPMELEKDADGQYWYVPKYPTTGPGGTPVTPRPVGGNLPTPAFAEEQKVEAKRLSDLRSAVLDRAKESAQANTMIANTETALQEAQRGNLGAGALSPQKLQIVATAKALGINLTPFGIDSDKLGAAQVTREQLQQLNGAILRKMYPQRITNADLAISGTVLPNYGLDEQALTSNFEIYKKQNDYDTRMAKDMLDYQDKHHTLVGWENQWHAKNGFGAGPIDNLFGDAQAGRLTSGGDGGNTKSARVPQEGDTATGKDGHKIVLRSGNWVPVVPQ